MQHAREQAVSHPGLGMIVSACLAVLKKMAQMLLALLALDCDFFHAGGEIRFRLDCIEHGSPEAGPLRAGLELVL